MRPGRPFSAVHTVVTATGFIVPTEISGMQEAFQSAVGHSLSVLAISAS
jgi:hypothetical protein